MKDPTDSVMEYGGYRNMIVEDKINECVSAYRRGESSVSIDAGDMTDSEIEYLKKEVERRIGNGS